MKHLQILLLSFRTKLAWVPSSRELGLVPSSQEPGSLYVFPSWEYPFIYQDLVFEKRAHTVLQREKTHVVLISQERERV
jgi:hypothetical protein